MSQISAEDLAFFEKEVRPLLVKRCFECHGGSETRGGLSLASAEGWKHGGDTRTMHSRSGPDYRRSCWQATNICIWTDGVVV